MKLPSIKNLSTARNGWLETAELVAASRAHPAPVASATTDAVADTIQRALASAGLDVHAAPMTNTAETIRRALSSAGLNQRPATLRLPTAPGHTAGGMSSARSSMADSALHPPQAPAQPASPGTFVTRSYTGAAGAREYKLYVPASYPAASGHPAALLVMLHGCTQSPDDFAAGTRMNALAEQHGFLVAYPAQTANANGSKCWNWFRPQDQQRGSGEPALIAGIAGEVASHYRVDPRRIYVAGLSAGAAMAVILGATYPDLFAAVGAHSGLAYRAAHDMPSALGAMKGGAANGRAQAGGTTIPSGHRVPTIVFHGDRDHTVAARNGVAIAEQAALTRANDAQLHTIQQSGATPGRGTYQQTINSNAAGQPVVEHWLLHGAGHAWSGGSPAGSYTDARGPDASAEMVRFFLSLDPAANSR